MNKIKIEVIGYLLIGFFLVAILAAWGRDLHTLSVNSLPVSERTNIPPYLRAKR